MSESGMKLNGGRCDFCAINESRFTINGGLWWICSSCMDAHFGVEEE